MRRYIDIKWKEFPGGDFCRRFWPKSPCLSIRKVLCWPFNSPWPVQSVTDIFPDVLILSLVYIIALVESKTSELNEGEKKKLGSKHHGTVEKLSFLSLLGLNCLFSYLINPPPWPPYLSPPPAIFATGPPLVLCHLQNPAFGGPSLNPCSEPGTRHLLQLNHASSITPPPP